MDISEHFRDALLRWFAANRRPLPWREDYSPYRTWIAEVMMQQTQMDRGVFYFQRWMERFPDVRAVAEASEEELLKYWEGLGYYRRARNIQAAARAVMEKYGGDFPSDPDVLKDLPGIGAYTAGAIASTAFNQDVPCVDGNAERVLSRFFALRGSLRRNPGKKRVLELASALIPPGRARDFNQALMELGALVCRKAPLCEDCPLTEDCSGRKQGIAADLPENGPSTRTEKVEMVTGLLVRAGRVFVQRRLDSDVWGGLWEFPGGCVEPGESHEEALIREWREELGFQIRVGKTLPAIRHAYTRYRITLNPFLIDVPEVTAGTTSGAEAGAGAGENWPDPPLLTAATAFRWLPLEDIESIPLPAPHRKLARTCAIFRNGQA